MAFEFETHRIRKYEPCKNPGEEQPPRRTACAKVQTEEQHVQRPSQKNSMCKGPGSGKSQCMRGADYLSVQGQSGLVEIGKAWGWPWTPRPGWSLDPTRLPMEVVVGKIGAI